MTVEEYLCLLLKRLKEAFNSRIVYAALSGSHARGEATGSSDIDVNTILDSASVDDLLRYRNIIKSMPQSHLACGFIAGVDEIKAWPKHELFQFLYGNKVLTGSLDGIVSFPTDDDIQLHIRITASAVYHMASHALIYSGDLSQETLSLKNAYKSTFFVLQELVYLQKRKYIPKRCNLLSHVSGLDLKVLQTAVNWDSLDIQKEPLAYFDQLIEWGKKTLSLFP